MLANVLRCVSRLASAATGTLPIKLGLSIGLRHVDQLPLVFLHEGLYANSNVDFQVWIPRRNSR